MLVTAATWFVFKMSDSEFELPEMDYDMWEGQFEFVGPTEPSRVGHGLLKPAPFLPSGTNGVKKSVAHVWCEDVSGKVTIAIFKLFFGHKNVALR